MYSSCTSCCVMNVLKDLRRTQSKEVCIRGLVSPFRSPQTRAWPPTSIVRPPNSHCRNKVGQFLTNGLSNPSRLVKFESGIVPHLNFTIIRFGSKPVFPPPCDLAFPPHVVAASRLGLPGQSIGLTSSTSRRPREPGDPLVETRERFRSEFTTVPLVTRTDVFNAFQRFSSSES